MEARRMLMKTSGKDGFTPFQPPKHVEKKDEAHLIPPKLTPPPPVPIINAPGQHQPEAHQK